MFGKQKDFTSVGSLIEGLPVPIQTIITTNLSPEGLFMKALIGRKKEDWKTFELPIEKIENIQLMNERQIKQVIEQSASGTILGAAAFGTLGALIGGRIQTKEKVKINTLLVIDYKSGEKKQIVLNVTDNIKDNERVVKRFRELKPVSNETIQL